MARLFFFHGSIDGQSGVRRRYNAGFCTATYVPVAKGSYPVFVTNSYGQQTNSYTFSVTQ